MNSSVIRAALKERFAAPEWALFFEVANGTGSAIRRYADAVAMNLFPSRGLEVHGVEIKVSRSDWTRELKNPEKAEQIWRFCDRWWVAAPAGIVRDEELPPTWGLLELKDGALRQKAAAPGLVAEPLSRPFVAALLRRAAEADHAMVDTLVMNKVGALREADEKRLAQRVEDRTRLLQEKLQHVEAIEKTLGCSLTDWHAHEWYGQILRAIDNLGLSRAWGGLRDTQKRLEQIAVSLKQEIDAFDAASATPKQDIDA